MRSPVLSIALVVATGCGGSLAQLRTDNHRLAGDLASLRAELRAERRKSRDLENQLLVAADRLETAAVHGPVPIGGPPRLPVEVGRSLRPRGRGAGAGWSRSRRASSRGSSSMAGPAASPT